ncbi:MAG: hypothetical protein JNK45_15010 [Myxococcales bacterium]|jgi:hypothetical protein|nr:hypothetical protein [Myxococcales bacterium]
MPSVTITYTDQTNTTIQGTSVSIVAVPNAEYRHNDKAVEKLHFTLGTSTSGTVKVTPSGAAMPPQTCFAGAAPSLGLPFNADWSMSSASLGILTVAIPSASTAAYPTRLEVIGGGNVDISIKH